MTTHTETITIKRVPGYEHLGELSLEIPCSPDDLLSVKLGLAVRKAIKDKLDLSGSDLRYSDLSGSNLSYSDLSGSNLSGDQIRHVKADFWYILSLARGEVPFLIAALRSGKVDGSTYDGACRCLVGTLEQGGAKSLPHESASPAESWFIPIRPGDLPGARGEGGFRSKFALEWALEFCALHNISMEQGP